MIEYADLLGVPWCKLSDDPSVGLDCVSVSDLVLRRHGIEGALPATEEAMLALLEQASESDRVGSWARVGDTADCADQLGDLILSHVRNPETGEDETHVSAVVSLAPPRAISSSEDRGVYVIRASRIRRVYGVWRWMP